MNKKNYPNNIKELLHPIKSKLILTVIISVLSSLSILLAPIFIAIAVGNMLNNNTNGFVWWIAFAGLAIVLNQMLYMFSLGYAHKVEIKFRYSLKKDFSEKLSKLPLGFFSTTSSGAIRKMISDDALRVHTIIAHGFTETAASLSLPIGAILVMFFFGWQTTLMILAFLVFTIAIAIIWMSIGNKSSDDISIRYDKAQRQMSHSAIEMVDGIKEIKNYGIQGSFFARFNNTLKEFSNVSYEWLSGSSKAFAFIQGALSPIVMMFVSLSASLYSINKGFIPTESIIVFILLSMALPSSLITLMQIGNHLKESLMAANNMISIYAKEDVEYKEKTIDFNLGDIEFKNVSFGYKENVRVLNNINCVIKENQITALVGPSGGGKTTMARLIARFWDVDEGKVTIANSNIKDLSESDLLKSITLVFQDISLMRATIRENISLAKEDATMEEIILAAKSAHIHDRIMKLEKGYDSVIGKDGVYLSGGENQRITIARAFLANSPIVILDEATAQSDARSEVEIRKALSLLSKNKTVIMIAHKLNSIVNADKIIVIENGKIVESGKHQELLENKDIYYDMYVSQNGGAV